MHKPWRLPTLLLNSPLMSTNNDPDNQLLGLSTKIKILWDGVLVDSYLTVSHELSKYTQVSKYTSIIERGARDHLTLILYIGLENY